MVTGKSGKRAKRGFMNIWHLTPKAFVFLRKTKRDSLDTKGLIEALKRERQRFFVREDPEYVYKRVLTLRLEVDSLIYGHGRLRQIDSDRMHQKATEFTKLMEEIKKQKNPRKGFCYVSSCGNLQHQPRNIQEKT